MHRRNVAQLIPLDTPRSRAMPRIQDPLDILGHPRHDDVGQQREGTGDRDEFLLAPAPCRGNAPEVDDPLQGMNRLAVVQDPEDLTAKGQVASIIAAEQAAQELPKSAAGLVNRVGPGRRPKALKRQDGRCPPAVNGCRHANELVPSHVQLA